MRWLLVFTIFGACLGCTGNDLRPADAADIAARVKQHKAWLAAGGCTPGVDGNIDRESPDIVVNTIGQREPATFFRANLRGANLSNQDLRCVSFLGADLTGASLFGADLRGALFNRASLVRANLERTDLRGAIFHSADLRGAVYQPKEPPSPSTLALAANLNHITYDDDPTLLYTLKNQLKERGYQDAQRSVIAALRRSHPPDDTFGSKLDLWRGEGARATQFVLFDLTAEFGSNAFRPLIGIFLLWAICGMVYAAAIMQEGRAALFLVSTGEPVPKGKKTVRVWRISARPGSLRMRLRSAVWTGLFFSFRRTFHFGFKELDFGNWLKLLQSREFDLKAYGWPRVVSGAQSILSIYLLAISILSAFTTPFDL